MAGGASNQGDHNEVSMFWRVFLIVCGVGSLACFSGKLSAGSAGTVSDDAAPANPRGGRGAWARHQSNTCSTFRTETGSCFTRFDGQEREACEVCREGRSCFLAVRDPDARALCEAYRENKSCFSSIRDRTDRGWCEYLKEGKSCFMALDGEDQKACERGVVPADHAFWAH